MSGAQEQIEGVPGTTKLSEPGASRYGNFINYYQFHTAEDRIRQLPSGIWQNLAISSNDERKYLVLDIGCNTGDLSVQLLEFLQSELAGREVTMLAVDLDPVLIERAREKNPYLQYLSFETLDFCVPEDRQAVLRRYLGEQGYERFDLVSCFSITMWIHLNHGDVGLERFLHDICSVTAALLLEPQPWKCYRNAARRLRRAGAGDFQHLDDLKYRGDMLTHIDRILREQCGFVQVTVTDQNDWRRTLLVYRVASETN